MDANEDYLDSLLNSVMSQELGGADGGFGGTQQNNGSEAELEEINELLKKSDQNQMPDSDMLAMLEKAESELPDGGLDHDEPDVFDIFSSESVGAEESAILKSGSEISDGISGRSSVTGEEAYLDALLNGTGSDLSTETDDQTGDEMISLDSLQSEEELPLVEDMLGGEDLLSLDNLQSEEELPLVEDMPGGEELLSLDNLQGEEELPPVEDISGGQDLLSLDSLQSEEELPPAEDISGGQDLLSLDSLQSEEELSPVEDISGGEDLLSLDSLQSEEELPPIEDISGGEDLLSLDSLQSDDMMSYEGLEEEETESEASTAEDDAIQREIDELLGLAGVSDEEKTSGNDSEGGQSAASVSEEVDTAKPKKKKAKKEKNKFRGKKAKGSGGSAQQTADGTENEGVGNDDLFGAVSADEMMSEADFGQTMETSGDADSSEAEKPKAKRKKEKAEKRKKNAASDNEQKEPGFFGKLLNTLFEETDEEDDQQQEMDMSDENREVIATVEGEKIENKKSGSKKAKKGKKGKAGAKQEAEGEDDEEAPVDEKKAAKDKKKREKKEKKEQKAKARKEKEEEEKAVPKKKLPRGKVFSIFAFCLTILAVIVILCFVIPQQMDLKRAREAYYEQDYLTVYENMEGKDLSDSDYILYMRSKLVLNMQGKLENYLVYMGMDKEMEALNELMLAVHYYQFNHALAEGYGALAEMDVIYTQVLSVLEQQYHINEQEAIDIFALDDLSYNERLYYLVYGTEFVAPGSLQNEAINGTDSTLGEYDTGNGNFDVPDVLPEEGEIIGDSPFQGNEGSDVTNDTGMHIPDGTGTDIPDTEIDDPSVQPTDENNGVQSSGGDSENQMPDTGNQQENNQTPGESLSQGNGDVLYSGEVQNGNAVLQ